MRKTGLLTALLLAAAPLRAQDAAPASTPSASPAQPMRKISLAEAVQMALASNLDIQVLRFNPEISRYSLSEAYAVYEPSLSFSVSRSNVKSPGGFDSQGRPLPSLIINETDWNAGVGNGIQGYGPMGFTYSLNSGLTKQNRSFPGTIGTDEYSGGAGITLGLPLLRDFWIDGPRATIQINRRNLRISEEQLRQQVMLTVLEVEQAYYNLIYARENVRVQATALDLASQLLRENRKRVEVGALAPLDEKQTEAEVSATRATLIDAERSLSQQQNILKGLITDKYPEWNEINLEPAEALVAVPTTSDLHDSWRKGLSQRPDLMQLKYALERTGITLKFRKNQLFPQLDLTGSYGHGERGDSFRDVLGDLPRGRNPRYSVGVSLDIPLGNRAARSRYRSAKEAESQALVDYKRLEQDIMIQIDDAVKLIRSSFERVEATRAARAFAQEALAAEQKKLENGKVTAFFVLQAQRDLTVRRSEEIRALADYNNAVALLANREGTTLERHNINFR